MYYTVIKHSSHLRTLEKCRKHSPAARAFHISLVFSNACRVLSQCNTRLRLLYLLSIDVEWSERRYHRSSALEPLSLITNGQLQTRSISPTISVISRWPSHTPFPPFNIGKHNLSELLARVRLQFVNNIERVGAEGRLK